MGTGFRSAADVPSDDEDDTETSLGDALDGVFADVDVDSVEVVREIRRDE